ncbi:MAG: hypothetical protein FJX53_06685 [Alphaproteobacteria bacterium]|nr:hypothetical protein [Alphaproteobacteria bacterium]
MPVDGLALAGRPHEAMRHGKSGDVLAVAIAVGRVRQNAARRQIGQQGDPPGMLVALDEELTVGLR